MPIRVRLSSGLGTAPTSLHSGFSAVQSAPARILTGVWHASIGTRRRFQMLDFTEGTTWFLSGFGVTAFFVVLIVVFAWFARRAEQR